MNKQEAIEKFKNLKGLTILDKTINFDSEMISKKEVLNIVKQLDDPEKPVVPRCVADFISSEQRSCSALAEAIDNMEMRDEGEVTGWFYDNSEAFAKAWLYGYEVEKEKLYTVELPNPNAEERPILFKKRDGKVHIVFPSVPCWRTVKNAQLTEAEIKRDFEWAWQFAEEVEE